MSEIDEARVRRYAEAITGAAQVGHWGVLTARSQAYWLDVARRVIAVADEEQAELRAEFKKYKRGAKTLGHTVEWQCRAVLDATGLHHLIGEDGDGDWALVWERLTELLPRAEAAEAELAEVSERLAAVEALRSLWIHDNDPLRPSRADVEALTTALRGTRDGES